MHRWRGLTKAGRPATSRSRRQTDRWQQGATIGEQHVPPRATTAPTFSLLYWRMQKGLIQIQLAEVSGVDRATIQRLQAGGEGRLSTNSKLASALDVTPAQLPYPGANMIKSRCDASFRYWLL